jgi:DNA polymerase
MVRGKGPLDADLMLVGEAPGYEENKAGEPFIGSAGRLLTKHLNEVGISREDTYITNVVKCQPPGNRNPTHSEMMACKEHLLREIVSVRPKIIVLMGRIAIKALSGRTGSMKDLHGVVSHMTIAIKDDVDSLPVEVVVVLTYHPAAELYHEFYTQFIQEDWKKIKQLLDEKKKEKKVTVQIPLNVDNEKQLKEQKKFLEGSDERRT